MPMSGTFDGPQIYQLTFRPYGRFFRQVMFTGVPWCAAILEVPFFSPTTIPVTSSADVNAVDPNDLGLFRIRRKKNGSSQAHTEGTSVYPMASKPSLKTFKEIRPRKGAAFEFPGYHTWSPQAPPSYAAHDLPERKVAPGQPRVQQCERLRTELPAFPRLSEFGVIYGLRHPF